MIQMPSPIRLLLRAHGIPEEQDSQLDLCHEEARIRYRWMRHGYIQAEHLMESETKKRIRKELER